MDERRNQSGEGFPRILILLSWADGYRVGKKGSGLQAHGHAMSWEPDQAGMTHIRSED